MDSTLIFYLAIVLLILLTLAGTVYLLYSGLLYPIQVDTGRPPVDNVVVAYKFNQGPYKECGKLFDEVCRLAPEQKSIGVYYDDPKQVAEDKLRYIAGCILAEGSEKPHPGLEETLTQKGFKVATFPHVARVVKAEFPCKTKLSILLAVYRVYSRLETYIQEHGLNVDVCVEIYDGDMIKFMAPLSKHEEFYVPEATARGEDCRGEASN